MDELQKMAIQSHLSELSDALQVTTQAFLSVLQQNGIISSVERQIIQTAALDRDQIIKALEILKQKDDAFIQITDYLRANGMSALANKLGNAANIANNRMELGLVNNNYHNNDNSTEIIKLTTDLIDFYLKSYQAVESFGGDKEPIELVWVNVHLAGDYSTSDNYNEIFLKMNGIGCNIAVVKGQPGCGKTTLVKRIAYGWAKQKQEEKSKKARFLNLITYKFIAKFKKGRKTNAVKYDLILAAPLRSVHSGYEPLDMAVSYLLTANGSNADQSNVEKLSTALRASSLKILVILDGLDEYEFEPNSLLAKMFGSAFPSDISTDNVTPIRFKYDLLVTSRPYACRNVNENLLTHKWEIAGFTDAQQKEFVQRRCKTIMGKARAAQYLQSSGLEGISEIPLLLLLVCFLSDRPKINIPDKLTSLFETFLSQMLMRSTKKGSFRNRSFDHEKWRKSDLIASFGRLALLGIVKNKFEFNSEEMEMCRVGLDCFESGLLLFRSDPITLANKADFPHRSIQEFFAALHCLDFWEFTSTISNTTGWPTEIWPIEGISEMKVEMLAAKTLIFGNSQFCRFYFGLLSGRPEFECKIKKSLEEYVDIYLIFPHFLFCLSNSLADCTDSECFLTGKIVNSLVERSLNWYKSGLTDAQARKTQIFVWTEEKRITEWPQPATTQFRDQLQSGLKLTWLGNSHNSFYLRNEAETEAKMMRIWLEEENLINEVTELHGLEKVEWLWIYRSGLFDLAKLRKALDVIKLLPKCRNCLITRDPTASFCIWLWLRKKSISINPLPVDNGDSDGNPEFIYLRLDQNLGEKIVGQLSLLKHKNSEEIEVQTIEPFSNGKQVRLLVSSSWSVWEFLRDEGILNVESNT